jgi:hypothetical protein
MIVNFRIREISRGTRKLARTPILIIIIKILFADASESSELKAIDDFGLSMFFEPGTSSTHCLFLPPLHYCMVPFPT